MNSKKLIFISVIFLLGCNTTQKVPINQPNTKTTMSNTIADEKDLHKNH